MNNKEFDRKRSKEEGEFLDQQLYPSSDDIYNKSIEEQEIDPEDITKRKEKINKSNRRANNSDDTMEELDVPGADLDDEDENIGNEDEENNYYSLGGDEHNDLEEDKGE